MFNRKKQSEEITVRDNEISNLRQEAHSLKNVISKHQDSYSVVKEKLIKSMTEFELRGALNDAEITKNVKLTQSLNQAEGAVEMMRQEKDFVRKQLGESENLLAQFSHQRLQTQEMDNALQHCREQIRLLSDNKNIQDSQLLVSCRDLEGSRYKHDSLMLRMDVVMKDKEKLIEDTVDLKQQLAKFRNCSAEEVGELKRELLKARDLIEAERSQRMMSESTGEMLKRREGEDRKLLSDAHEKEREALRRERGIEDQGHALENRLQALRRELEEKEAQRAAAVAQKGVLDVQTSKLQLQLEAIQRSKEEVTEKYEVLRSEGRYCRQQVLQAVKYAVDIANMAVIQRDDGMHNVVASVSVNDIERGRILRPLLMLSPRGHAASRSPKRNSTSNLFGETKAPVDGSFIFSELGDPHIDPYSSPRQSYNGVRYGGELEVDPFDRNVLTGLSEALCLPDLRNALQAVADQMEILFKESQHPVSDPTVHLDLQKSEENQRLQEENVVELKKEIKESGLKSIDLYTIIENLREAASHYESDKGEIEKTGKGEIEDLRRQLVALSEKGREEIHEGRRGDNDGFDSKEKEFNSTIIDLKLVIKDLRERISELEDERDEGGLHNQLGDEGKERALNVMLKKDLRSLNKDLEAAHITIAELTTELESLQASRYVKETNGAQASKETIKAKHEVPSLSPPTSTDMVSDNTIQALTLKLRTSEETVEVLTLKLNNAEVAFQALQIKLNVQIEGASIVAKQLETKEEVLQALQSKLSHVEDHNVVLTQAIKHLEKLLKTEGDDHAESSSSYQEEIRLLEKQVLSGSCSIRSIKRECQDSNEEITSIAFQALEKLRIRSKIRGQIVAIYRQCLFALKDEKVTASLIRHSVIEKYHNGFELNDDVGDVYDHDKDLDLSRTNSDRRNIEINGNNKYENNQQGDELCIW
eukprot:CAMPEP_0119053596 /NCGR_PEP_ID=MMETSP1177-20130426/74528_1 /TAXON_ID=2985 /ORGANISM="Ochromonas sp, Strain CCMP1899" /LENGTH=930 /DNA_ID=CAMNT_0007033587 /DNA_START=184 /DNA_END=2973 /DNA_ORIENTATION=-